MNIENSQRVAARRIWPAGVLFGLLMSCCWQVSPVRGQVPVAIPDSSLPVAFTNNNTGSASTYVLNADSSVSVLQNSLLVPAAGCAPLLGAGSAVSKAALAFDVSTNRLWAVMSADSASGAGLGTVVTYATFATNGTCTVVPAVQISNTGFATLEIAVDSSQGNVYVVQETQGGSLDALYVLSIGALSTYSTTSNQAPQVNLDYSSSYGPIQIDPTTHRVYINDFGDATNLPPGLNPSPGFFVYDPNHSATPSSNIQHVFGYAPTPTTTANFSAQALLVRAGDLILVNQNTSISSGAGATYQTAPFTILHTTAAGFSFFTNTLPGPAGPSSSVYIQPGTSGITVVNPSSGASILDFSAIGGADIDAVHGIIYRYTYDVSSTNSFSASLVLSTGALVSYNLNTQKDTQLTSTGLPYANYYPSPNVEAWNQLTFNPASDSVVLYASGAVGVSSSLGCATVSVQQVLGGGTTYSIIGAPALNLSSGYIYDTQEIYPNTVVYYVAPPATCASAALTLTPTSLPNGIAGQPYPPVVLSASGGFSMAGLSFGATGLPQGMGISGGVNLGGTPTTIGPYEVTITATDTEGDQGSEIIPLTITCPTITVGPNPLPGAVQGVFYSIGLTSNGGVGGITYEAFGPFPPGITFNGTGFSGTPTATGAFQMGIQATDANGCKSVNAIQSLTVSAPRFSMAPVGPAGSVNCPAPGPGFPFGVVPTANINGISYYQVNVNLFNSGNVAANANLTSAVLGGYQDVNASSPGVPIFPIIFNNPGTLLQPGGCVSLTFYYPTNDYTSVSVAGGFNQSNIPQILQLKGTFAASSAVTPPYSGNWTLTDRQVLLSTTICCSVSQGAAGTALNPNPNPGGGTSVGGNP
jgi:hypothetical protein